MVNGTERANSADTSGVVPGKITEDDRDKMKQIALYGSLAMTAAYYLSVKLEPEPDINSSYEIRKDIIDGKEIIFNKNGVNNGGQAIDQYTTGLPGNEKACTYTATYVASDIVSDMKLNSIENTYELSDDNSVNNGKDPMYLKTYNGIAINSNATDIVIDERGTWIDKNTGTVKTDQVTTNAAAVQDMVNVLDNKGAIEPRVTGHTAIFNGYAVLDNKLTFTVIDAGHNKNTYYDPVQRQMFKVVDGERIYDKK